MRKELFVTRIEGIISVPKLNNLLNNITATGQKAWIVLLLITNTLKKKPLGSTKTHCILNYFFLLPPIPHSPNPPLSQSPTPSIPHFPFPPLSQLLHSHSPTTPIHWLMIKPTRNHQYATFVISKFNLIVRPTGHKQKK